MPIMVDSSRWSVLEAGPQVPAGQGRRQLDLAQGGRGGVPRAGAHDPPLRRRRRRDGVRRAGPGRHRRAQGRDLRPRLRPARRQVGFAPEDIIFDPNVLAVATGIEEHNELREGVHRGAAADQGALSRRRGRAAASRTSRFSFRGNDARARGDALRVPLPRDPAPASTWASSTPGQLDRLRGHRARAARARRGRASSTAGPTRPSGCVEYAGRVKGEATKRELDLAWREAPRRAAPRRTRSCTASSTSSRRTPRRRGSGTRGRST